MSYIVLRNWTAIIPPGVNPHMSEEQRLSSLSGQVYGHPNHEIFPDGTQVITTGVTGCKGVIAQTASGKTYRLEGEPKASFLEWLDKSGLVYNPEDPLSPTRKTV
jgi:hypothetical protein